MLTRALSMSLPRRSSSFLPHTARTMSASFFGRKLFSGAASTGATGTTGAQMGAFEKFAKNYYEKYIKTNSIVPVLHIMGLYSLTHWAIVYKHKHSQ
jgi:hypothetical protein